MNYRIAFLLCSLGCTASGDGGTDSGTNGALEPPSETLANRLGCKVDLEPFQTVQNESTDITTVQRLHWQSYEPITPRFVADVGRTDWIEGPPPSQPSMEGELLVLGIPALRSAEVLLVTDTDEGLACSESIELEPAGIDPNLPALTLRTNGTSTGYTTMAMMTEFENYRVIIDAHGEYVWTQALGPAAHSREMFSITEPSILSLEWAVDAHSMGHIERIDLDGTTLERTALPGIHTDFIERPDGGLAAISWVIHEIEDELGQLHRVLGDRIVESTEDGGFIEVWSAIDDFTPDLNHDMPAGSYPADPSILDWSHVNGFSYDQNNDDYLISVDGLNALIRVDRSTGERVWILSDEIGDFADANTERLVHGAHSVEAIDEHRLLVFNRNISYPFTTEELDTACSEAIEITLDSDQGYAEKTWHFGSEDCVLTTFYGEAQRLDNGNTLVVFSSSGQISEANSNGETVWQIQTALGAAFGFGNRVSSLY